MARKSPASRGISALPPAPVVTQSSLPTQVHPGACLLLISRWGLREQATCSSLPTADCWPIAVGESEHLFQAAITRRSSPEPIQSGIITKNASWAFLAQE